jgi:hypothetical protein
VIVIVLGLRWSELVVMMPHGVPACVLRALRSLVRRVSGCVCPSTCTRSDRHALAVVCDRCVYAAGIVLVRNYASSMDVCYAVCVQLGDGTNTNRNTPPSSDVLTGVAALAAWGAHTCALMATGGVRCWGMNDNGQASHPFTIVLCARC